MGRYMRKCKGIGEVAVMEVAQVGVRTRARALAMATAATGRRRKVGGGGGGSGGELRFASPKCLQLRSGRRRVVIAAENSVSNSPARSSSVVVVEDHGRIGGSEDRCLSPSSDHVQASCCSSNGSSELGGGGGVKERENNFVDLEEESDEVDTSTYFDCRERRETTPCSEVGAESDDMESTARPSSEANSRLRSTAEKMPTQPTKSEIDEFFSAAEKDVQKRFADKYNYDIVKDVPLEGRYEWVRLKP